MFMRALVSKEAMLLVASVFVAGIIIFLLTDFFILSPLIPDKSKFQIHERFDHGWYTLKANLDGAQASQLLSTWPGAVK